jgi:hypothetical protein
MTEGSAASLMKSFLRYILLPLGVYAAYLAALGPFSTLEPSD